MKSKINYKRVATIDIGSNAIRMLVSNVYNINGKKISTKNNIVRIPLRLGKESFSDSTLSESSLEKLIKSFKAFKLLMEVNGVDLHLAYATSAIRNIKDSQEIIKRIFEETGIKLDVISGKKEAQITSKQDISDHIGKSKNYCFVDVGGGSTEVIIFKNSKIFKLKSFKIGCVRLLDDSVNNQTWSKFEYWLTENAKELKKLKIVGIGGNINKIFKISGTKYSKPLGKKSFLKTLKKIESMSISERLTVLKLNPDRADVIVPAGKIYYFILKTLKVKDIYVPKIGLADGMVNELVK
ncbi:MAG: exopolyphosphatase [Flavobacteriaceae bacterium]